jgi:hypothetical protein
MIQQQFISDPACFIKVLTDSLEKLQINIEELSAADVRHMRQKRGAD